MLNSCQNIACTLVMRKALGETLLHNIFAARLGNLWLVQHLEAGVVICHGSDLIVGRRQLCLKDHREHRPFSSEARSAFSSILSTISQAKRTEKQEVASRPSEVWEACMFTAPSGSQHSLDQPPEKSTTCKPLLQAYM